MRKAHKKVMSLLLAGIAIFGTLFISNTNTYADESQEARVEITVQNDPASATATGPEQGALIPEGGTLESTTITYQNAKKIVVTLVDPDGNVLGTKTIEVDFSPDAKSLTIDWENLALEKFGKYTIKVVTASTDGTEVVNESLFFYYGEIPAESATSPNVPDTGALNFFGIEVSKGDAVVGILIGIVAMFIGLVLVLRKGAKNEN